MKPIQTLRQYEFRIPSSVYETTESKENNNAYEQLPLLKANIDFEIGDVTIDCDWNFAMRSSGHSNPKLQKSQGERILLKIRFTPDMPLAIQEEICFDWVWPIQGCLFDGKNASECNGIMILNRSEPIPPTSCHEWHINIYIYNSHLDNTEIKLKLPIYFATERFGNN